MYSLDAAGGELLPVSIAPVIRRVGVVGLGTMGAGIAQVSAQAGFETIGREVSAELCEKARGTIEHYVGRAVEKGKATAEERDATLGRLSFTTELAELADCDLVIEAIVEELEPKREVFAELDRIVGPDAILASNTSAIPIHAIAEATERPERVIGMHFFNPAPLLPLVEIIRAEKSSDEARRTRPTSGPSRPASSPCARTTRPGSSSTAILVPTLNECIRLLDEGITPEDLDKAMTKGVGWPMGPVHARRPRRASTSTSTPPRRCTRRPATSARSRRSACARWPQKAASAARPAAASTTTPREPRGASRRSRRAARPSGSPIDAAKLSAPAAKTFAPPGVS